VGLRRSPDDLDFVFTPRATGADGPGLRTLLEAHLRYEHAGGVRRLLGGLQLVLGAPVWVSAARPAWVPDDLRRLVLTAFALTFVAFLVAMLVEWRCRLSSVRLADGGGRAGGDRGAGAPGCTDRRGEAI
jgi:hypothetical protein